MASTHLTFTNGTPTNNAKFTISVWSKRIGLASSDYMNIMNSRQTSSTSGLGLWWGNDSFYYNFGTGTTGTAYCQSTAKYRDVNGWYHMVVAGDTTQSGTDKLKFWINGEQITSFSNDQRSSFVGLDYDIGNTNYPILIGMKHDGTYYYNGLLSHLHFIDGTAYQPSDFGSTDATTGEWKINTSPSVTYGNNGFFILKDGNSVTDQSGNGNNFTVGGGTLTNTEDCPNNVFCTWNSLTKGSYIDLNYGNTNVYGNTVTNNGNTWGTISFPPSGKYYWETKVISYHANASSGYPQIGIIRDNTISQGDMNGGTGGYVSSSNDCYYPAGGTTIYSKNGNVTVSATSLNDIIMCAMDSTAGNMKFWMGVNGTWFNSGDPANGTNAIWTETGDYQPVPFMSGYNGSRGDSNFGNGYFGTTAVSSAGTNASGNGIFEYDVPTGYTALSTKGLNL